ncbi:MAG: hypothetical protein ABR968_11715, partial [Bacteroidales bacterium]
MKKLLFLLFACGLMGISSYAQVANYTFSQATSTYTEITGGTVLGDTTIDEQFFVDPAVPLGGVTPTGPGLPIGFTFVYNGIPYNVFGVNTNAWISFGQDTIATNHVNLTSTTYTTPISTASTAPAKLQDRISPFGRNIAAQLGSELSYLTSGAAPNRTLTIQWKHFRRNTQRGEDFNFQIVLHETTNVIEFIYGAVTVNASNATSPQIGLRGSVATDFNNRSTTTDWSATTAGTLNTSSVAISLTVYPTPGLIYRWTPPLALDAGVTIINSPSTATSSAVSGLNKIAVTVKNFGTSTLTSATVDWTVNGAAQTPYSWTGSLTLNQTSGPDTIGAYTFTTPGIYTIKAWTTAPNGGTDLNNSNDTMTKVVYVAGYASLPFSEDFDHAWILSTSEVPSIYWTNSPNTGNSSWRRDDQGVSAALWTNNNGTYAPTGTGSGTLHSARFHAVGAGTTPGIFDANLNFSTAGTKMLKFFYVNTATANDSLVVSVSFNNGTTFKRLNKYTTNTSWTQYTLNLGDSTNTQTIIKFEGYSLTGMGAPTIDFGIDSIQVYLLPANDMAAVSFLAPVSGCASANDSVMVKIANVGTASQSNIPVYYSINGTVIGPETVTGPVASGDTVIYKFTHLANLSAGGPYIFKAWVKLATDVNHSNDSVFANVNAIGIIHTFPFVEDFNSTQYYFTETTAANAGAAFYSNGGVGGTGCAFTTGASAATGWMNGVTSAAIAYSYTTHLASLAPCSVDATGLTKLRMSFDLKQTYSSQQTYTWLCAIANGTDTLMDVNGIKYYNPTTASSDPFTTRIFDLSALAGTSFTIKLESACKYDSAHSAPGNNNYIDNIKFWEPVLIDAGVTAVLSPVTKACGVAHDTIKAIVENFGLDTLTKIPVVAKVTTPTGAHAFFYDTIAGPLAPNASTTIAIGNGSTVLASILPYFIK